jgi:hypothetical protein
LEENPIEETSIVKGGFFCVDKVKFPSKSVVVPISSPTILMLAPGIGWLVLSTTFPDIVDWAKEIPQKNNVSRINFTFIKLEFLLVYVTKVQIFLILIKNRKKFIVIINYVLSFLNYPQQYLLNNI